MATYYAWLLVSFIGVFVGSLIGILLVRQFMYLNESYRYNKILKDDEK